MKHNNKPMDVFIAKNKNEAIHYFLTIWKKECLTSIKTKNAFNVALSGGTTPLPFYSALAKNLNNEKINIFLADERLVAANSKQSNFKAIKTALLSKDKKQKINILNINTSLSKEKAKTAYTQSVLKTLPRLKGIPYFDLIILGIGEDGHTASLFPNNTKWQNTTELLIISKKKNDLFFRISLTPYIINNSKKIIFIATGKEKAKIIPKILAANKKYPASFIQPQNSKPTFILDKNAACLIS